MRKPKPALLHALEFLKSVSGTDKPVCLERAFDACRNAPDDVHYSHALYREIGEIALRHSLWITAEEFAVKSLLAVPSYGAALKVMGLALRGQGRLADAAICHRYGLPTTLRQKYFANNTFQSIRSDDSGQVNRLPAYSAETRKLTPPISVDEEKEWELTHGELHSSEANTFQLKSAQLWFDGFNTVVWNSARQTIEDLSRGLADVVQCSLTSRTPTSLPGITCLLGNRNSNNYYHWMNDILPRIQVLIASGIDVKSIRQFILNPIKHSFQYETLAKLGIDEARLCFSTSQNYFQCDELLVPVYGSNALGMRQGKWIPDFLKSSFLEDHDSAPQQRVYISRKNATGRAVENETELHDFLTQRGFKTVHLEHMSVGDQARLFNSAAVVISPHGAGLSNTAFCQAGSTIIELYRDHMAPCFWITSELKSLRHAVLFCGEKRDETVAHGSETYHISADKRRSSDFSVDLVKLEHLFSRLNID